MEESSPKEKFIKLGLDEKLVKDIMNNKKLSKLLSEMYAIANLQDGQKKKAMLIYDFCSKLTEILIRFKVTIVKFIAEDKINSPEKLDIAITELKNLKKDEDINMAEFEKKCGFGVEINEEDIKAAVLKYL